MAGLRGDLRDAGAHRAGADDGDTAARGRPGAIASCPLKRGARFAMNAATPSR